MCLKGGMISLALPSIEEASEILGPDGPFAHALPSFEWRPAQQQMAISVVRTFADGGVALVEAGTGTGKSLAYLVPAALFAVQTGKRVVISTNTINLQEQLLHKDIPLVRTALLPDLRSCLVKGWHNYLCLYRLQMAQQMTSSVLDIGLEDTLGEVVEWAATTQEGTLSEWARRPNVWDEVCAESDTCLRNQCPFYQQCFLFKARAQMEEAHLLVVNHHLLFADVAVRRAIGYDSEKAVLPHYEHVVLDEAHHVKDVATEFLGAQLTEYGMGRLLGRIWRQGSGGERGALSVLSAAAVNKSTSSELGPPAKQVLQMLDQSCVPALTQVEQARRLFVSSVRTWMDEPGESQGARRIRPGKDQERWHAQVTAAAETLAGATRALAGALTEIKEVANPLLSELPGVERELGALAGRCKEQAELATFLGEARGDENVFWADFSGRRRLVKVAATPLDVGPMLAEWFDHLAGAVCTSATLTVAKSFRYTSSGIGLSKSAHQTAEVLIPSPFNYKNQALVGVTRDLPLPTESRYPRQLAAAVTKLIRASQGRAFVLFTSYALLERVARDVKPVCDEEGWPLLVQGEAPRTRLLETFRNGNAVLFGTDSFWEGVDVPGTALSAVILTRLPFRVPDDPITEARTEALKRAGHDPFFSYSLPEAVLKFKQGFGRLIRSRQDRGVVVVCDKRILNRRYGRYFFASLPECEGVAGSLTVVDEAVRQWLQ